MSDKARLYLITPVVSDPEAFAPRLAAACAAGDVAALLLRLAPADERTLIRRVKALAPVAQQHDVAVLVDAPPVVASRGGADGAHLHAPDAETIGEAVSALQPERIVGVSGLRLRHDAMAAGEANVDYLMFGDPAGGGDFETTREWAQWWATLFATPCVACAGAPEEVGPLAATGAEFVALGHWAFEGDVTASVRAALQTIAETEVPAA
ncbi:thiamine phosphate synthase [Camelimonas abortus]|uniref:Thiamine phosphate synthase n=1 Tax=Camelimonas abortus TaxID=1017184 RepID=A0ABV7LDQ4_9HYPH